MGLTGRPWRSYSESTLMGNTYSKTGRRGWQLIRENLHSSQPGQARSSYFFLPWNYFLSCGPFTGAVFSEQSFFGRLPVRSKPTMPESQCHLPTQEVAQLKCVDINWIKIHCIIWNSWVGRASRKGHLCVIRFNNGPYSNVIVTGNL